MLLDLRVVGKEFQTLVTRTKKEFWYVRVLHLGGRKVSRLTEVDLVIRD